MPVRKIPMNYRYLTGLVAPTMEAFEATLERDFYILLRDDPRVASFEGQPIEVTYVDSDGVERKYTPDVLVSYKGPSGKVTSKHLYEVKPRELIRELWPEIKPKYRAARRAARERGWTFGFITDKEIRTQYLENLKFLHRYRSYPINPDFSRKLLEALMAERESTPSQLLNRISQNRFEQAELIPNLWALVTTGEIECDLDELLTMSTPIRAVATLETA